MKMAALTRHDLRWFHTPHTWPCLSIYADITRDGYQPEGMLQRIVETVTHLHEQLQQSGLSAAQAASLTAPIRALDQPGLQGLYRDFAGKKLASVAFFISPDGMRGYVARERLPNLSAIRPHFEIRPLLAATSIFESFHLLCVSPKEVKLWRVDQLGMERVELPHEVPISQRSYLENTEFSPKLAYHATGAGLPGATVGKWYGTVARDKEDKMLDDYALAVARPLNHLLAKDNIPVVIAAVKDLAVMLRRHLKMPVLVDEDIAVSPEHLLQPELEQRARDLVKSLEESLTADQLLRYKEHFGTPRTASTRDDIWDAAKGGKIDVLLASSDRSIPVEDDRVELVSACIQEVLNRKGRVLLTDDRFLTDSCPMGAILRW